MGSLEAVRFWLLGGGLGSWRPPVGREDGELPGGEDGELRLSHPEVVLQGKQRAEGAQ